MSSYGGAKRWWDDYLVRYFMPTIAGVAIVIWIGHIADAGVAGKPFQELLLLPKTTHDIDIPTLILLLLYGNLFCYVASFPILSFHATRVLEFKNTTWPKSHLWNGYIATAVMSVIVLLISLCFHNKMPYWGAFLPAIFFSCIQVARIWMVRKSVYGYASALAKRRSLQKETETEALTRRFFNDKGRSMQWREDLVETYRHQREHGNSGFIFLLELVLAGLTYCIVANGELSDPLKKLSAVGILFGFWAFPAALVHMLAQHLERRFSRYDFDLPPESVQPSVQELGLDPPD